jgi:hypothetical protein
MQTVDVSLVLPADVPSQDASVAAVRKTARLAQTPERFKDFILPQLGPKRKRDDEVSSKPLDMDDLTDDPCVLVDIDPFHPLWIEHLRKLRNQPFCDPVSHNEMIAVANHVDEVVDIGLLDSELFDQLSKDLPLPDMPVLPTELNWDVGALDWEGLFNALTANDV